MGAPPFQVCLLLPASCTELSASFLYCLHPPPIHTGVTLLDTVLGHPRAQLRVCLLHSRSPEGGMKLQNVLDNMTNIPGTIKHNYVSAPPHVLKNVPPSSTKSTTWQVGCRGPRWHLRSCEVQPFWAKAPFTGKGASSQSKAEPPGLGQTSSGYNFSQWGS